VKPRTANLILGDARACLRTLPEASAQTCITSPPYLQVRSYLKAGDPAKRFELGQEETPELFVAHLVDVCREIRRVLRDDGTLWLVIGDKHCDDRIWGGRSGDQGKNGGRSPRAKVRTGLAEGNLAGVPYRVALALQADGWLWRSLIVWEKVSCMPGSQFGWHWAPHRMKVAGGERAAAGSKHAEAHWKPQGSRNGRTFTGRAKWAPCPGCALCLPNGGLVLRRGKWRPTVSHETILMFSKSATYYADGEGVREPDAGADHKHRNVLQEIDRSGGVLGINTGIRTANGRNGQGRNLRTVWRDAGGAANPDLLDFLAARFGEEELKEALAEFRARDGAMTDIWTLGPEPLAEAHHAAFPSEIPRRLVACSTPEKSCSACGAPYARVLTKSFTPQADVSAAKRSRGAGGTKGMDASNGWQGVERGSTSSKTTGWRPTCGCNAEARPAVVLDCFMGSGRTGVAALEMGRSFIGIDLSRVYLETIAQPAIGRALAQDLIGEERDHLPLEVVDQQASLFGEATP